MKKKLLIILLVILTLLGTVTVQAASPRAIQAMPNITFNGTEAICSLTITAERVTDRITATMELKQGNRLIDSWTSSATMFLYMEETATVEENKTYTLVVTYSVNGVTRPSISIDRTND